MLPFSFFVTGERYRKDMVGVWVIIEKGRGRMLLFCGDKDSLYEVVYIQRQDT